MREKRGQSKHLLNFGANVVALFFEVATFAFVWYRCYVANFGQMYWRRGNWAVIGLYGLVIFLLTRGMNGYKISYLPLTDIWISNILAIIFGAAVAYIEVNLVTRTGVYLSAIPILAMAGVQILFIVPWVFFVRRTYIWLYPPRQMMVVYGAHLPRELIRKINSREDKYNVCAAMCFFDDEDAVFEEIHNYEAVVLCDLPASDRNRILKFCYEQGIRTYVTPKLSDILLNAAEEIHLFDTPLMLSRNQGLSITQRFFKRLFDILISLILTVILSPFMLITAICIKSCDGGPVFYKQDRLTIGKEDFQIIKFRSMWVDSEKNGAQLARKEDDRITPVGRVIRRIHFDEIPQLFNILKGEMSFVGPRPERRDIHEQYKKDIPEFDYRLKVKAGLTGYAQVYGKYNTTPYDKLKLDLTYIQKYSLLLDLKLILLTVKVIFQKENTEGINADQMTALGDNEQRRLQMQEDENIQVVTKAPIMNKSSFGSSHIKSGEKE